jgi:predicted site-specific integrase-resolvase
MAGAKQRNIFDWDNEVPVIMDLAFASRLVGLKPDTLKRLGEKGKLPAFKLSENSWRIRKCKLLEFIEAREKEVLA